jgi:hypothetical protein
MTDLRYVLQRQPSGATSTIGLVTVGDAVKWWTCEDVVREPSSRPVTEDSLTARSNLAAWVASWKKPGETAIPAGVYRLAFTPSQRFGRETIQVLDVPGFSGIRIHSGNTSADTEGCILPGLEQAKGVVFRSRDAVRAWEDEVHTALKLARSVWLEVRNA